MFSIVKYFVPLYLLLCSLSRAQPTDEFGGYMPVTQQATGYFRVEKIRERWFFITPHGHPYIALGGNHVGAFLKNEVEKSDLAKAFEGDIDLAAEHLLLQLQDLGLNAGDAYQPDQRFATRLTWVKSFSYLPDRKRWPDIFKQTEMSQMHEHVRNQCAEIADQPYVLGVAGPDLPRWDHSFLVPYLQSDPHSETRKGFVTVLQERYQGDWEQFDNNWKTGFADWHELLQANPLPLKADTIEAQADENWLLGWLADKHFAAVRKACKAGAPQHLYFGERTQLQTISPPVLQAMGKYIDVFCTQSLIRLPKDPPEWQLFQPAHYDREFELVNKPMIIIDWAAPFTLEQNAVTTEYGTLQTEADSARQSAQFVHDAFKRPYMIGLFICQVLGNHGNDKFFTNAKRTYLQDDGLPYPTRFRELKQANRDVLHRLYLLAE